MRISILAFALLTGCGSAKDDGSADLLATFDTELDQLQQALDAYVTGVGNAVAVSVVSDLQTTYAADAGDAMDGMDHALGEMEGCTHMDGGEMGVMDAQGSMRAMHDALEDLVTAHALHTDVTECQGLAASHEQVLSDEMTAMAEHHDDWGGMNCESRHMGGDSPMR